jgi:EAL domain-containing protein (putative c-di-GMP-specific phosphodiesterase class I)
MESEPAEQIAPGDLAAALETHQFFLVYQPTIDLETNAFAGVEALIRWRHPTRGVLSPEVFIEELEVSGEIVPVGKWALQTACAQGAGWHDKGYRFKVSVNVSPRQFSFAGFYEDVASAPPCSYSNSLKVRLRPTEMRQEDAWLDYASSACNLPSTTSSPARPRSTSCRNSL